MHLQEVTFSEFEAHAASMGVDLPIEQTAAWSALEETIPGRSQWGSFELVSDDGSTVAFIAFTDYLTHGYHYLRAHHAPVWVEQPTPEQEREGLLAIRAGIRRRDKKVLFARLAVDAELDITSPTLSMTPYDTTVIMDVTGTPDDILNRMKTRGRRDVRKALRESPATYADETDRATASFDEYYDVMVETAARDGFTPAPKSDYENTIRILGPEKCRVFAGRINGEVVTWTITTISGAHATRYYGASRANIPNRNFVTDGLIFFEACTLGEQGIVDYDMMGIGSEKYPGLMTLNTFKCKFAKDETHVAPDRDLPVARMAYAALQGVKGIRDARRERAAARAGKADPRTDILPVVLGGDLSVYAICREFHEAYGCRPVAMNAGVIAAITHSEIIDTVLTPNMQEASFEAAIRELADADPARTVVLLANTDGLVDMITSMLPRLPKNVVSPTPSAEVVERVRDKVLFQRLCEQLGLPVPRTEVVSLAGADAVAPTQIAFPVVAKAARSDEYMRMYEKGFKKVYKADGQAELDELWASLREAGFAGDFLVQELIPGDDTCMGALTFYVDSRGKVRVYGAAQALLEDHAPTMRGNSVAMLTRPMPELLPLAERLFSELGYRGFAEIDLKRDPRTGEWVFFELNPRVGRNSYYLVAGGVNPMRAMVDDLVDGKTGSTLVADEPALYTVVPRPLLMRYVVDPALRAEVEGLYKGGKVVDPQRYAPDMSPRRALDVQLTEANHFRKFRRYYPKPTQNSF